MKLNGRDEDKREARETKKDERSGVTGETRRNGGEKEGKERWSRNEDEDNRRSRRCLPFIKLLLNAAFLRTHNWIGKTAKIMPRPYTVHGQGPGSLRTGRLTANTSFLYTLKWTPCNPSFYTAMPHWPAPPGMHIDHYLNNASNKCCRRLCVFAVCEKGGGRGETENDCWTTVKIVHPLSTGIVHL